MTKSRFLLGTALVAAFAALPANARELVDRKAGIEFDVPFHVSRLLRGAQIEAVLKKQLGRVPGDVRYTSAVYADGSVPFVLVWTRSAAGGISRPVADRLRDGGPGGFAFEPAKLLGEGSLPDQGGYHVRLLLQLVRDRYTYVGYYYKVPSQLAAFEHIKKTLKVGNRSRLSYQTLPAAPGRSWGLVALEALAALGTVTLIGAGAVYTYKWMGRDGYAPPPPSARPEAAGPVAGLEGSVPLPADGPRV